VTNSATSGRRLCLAYSPRSWQTARKSLFAGVAKSISRTGAPPMLPSGSLVLGRDAVDEETMDGAVAEVERRAFGVEELAEDVVQSLGRELRVQPGQGSPQPPFEDYLSVVGALGATDNGVQRWRLAQLDAIVEPGNWRWQTCEPSPAIRRDYEAAGPMVWRLLRRLPAYAHLPEQHPPRGETYAEAERQYWQERVRGC
jgi:hypothetical protein